MKPYTRIGVICDMHMQSYKKSPQLAFLKLALDKMKTDDVDAVICLGDITGFGDLEALELYMETMKDFTHYEVLGNTDVRNKETRALFEQRIQDVDFYVGNRRVFGINTPDGTITQHDRERLQDIKAGDIVFMHYYMKTLDEDSATYLTKLASDVPITILHGHGHRIFDYDIEQSHVYGMRGLDPDKAMGDFPSIAYLDISDDRVKLEEIIIKLPKEYLQNTANFFGISCVDNHKDVLYALENNVKHIELRCNGKDWFPDETLFPLIEKWRAKTNGYLSVHMPNLRYADGNFAGFDKWDEALAYASKLKADGYTMHPPRVRVCDMPAGGEIWNYFLKAYVKAVRMAGPTANMGIENIHKSDLESHDDTRGFGYIPNEVCAWIDAINRAIGFKRVGTILDVGHARNNGNFAKMYPSSKWYCMMGDKTVGYHIHQVVPIPGAYKNHNPLENWFGPMINYTAFFYAFNNGILNNVPVFLEVKGAENYQKSIDAITSIIDTL